MELWYEFIDREVVDRVLRKSWRRFLKEYSWDREDVASFLDLTLPPSLSERGLDDYIDQETVGWALRQSDCTLLALEYLVNEVPELAPRTAVVSRDDGHLADMAVLLGTAAEAFLSSKIDRQTVWSVLTLHDDPLEDWLDISEEEMRPMVAKKYWGLTAPNFTLPSFQEPVYRWQTAKNADGRYRSLGVASTKRFIRFIRQAWDKNWSVPRLKAEVCDRLGVRQNRTPHFRQFDIADAFAGCVKSLRFRRPCMWKYFG